jgi:tetratricopeptide (TPR) repeat protein
MGKKSKNALGQAKAAARKVDKSTLPPPPPPITKELGSAKTLEQPGLPGTGFKVLNGEGYDDGGVADLSLLIDLEDNVLRRRRGDNEYFTALKQDVLPRATKGPMARLTRREQKVSLAQLLFSEDEDTEDKGPSEVYTEQASDDDDPDTIKYRSERLGQARAALRLSLLLRESACTSLSLSELCKRRLTFYGKKGAEDALRCADKALEIAGSGFWDGDEIAIEAEDVVVLPEKYEKNATTPGLAHPSTLKLLPIRVSNLCERSALLQRGNALAALNREAEARETYEKVFPLLENEPRCARVDWERISIYVNIGNTFSRSGDYANADKYYVMAENLGNDHLINEEGSKKDGKGMVACARRSRAFAMRRDGKVEEAKALLKEVIEQQIKDNLEAEKEAAAEKESS